jgi:hypothetical protein
VGTLGVLAKAKPSWQANFRDFRRSITMQNTIEIACPQEILLGLHLDAEQFADLVKEEAAIALFREGRLSSGMAASWLGVPRAHFLLKAMQTGGASLLENNEDDFLRETSLL